MSGCMFRSAARSVSVGQEVSLRLGRCWIGRTQKTSKSADEYPLNARACTEFPRETRAPSPDVRRALHSYTQIHVHAHTNSRIFVHGCVCVLRACVSVCAACLCASVSVSHSSESVCVESE